MPALKELMVIYMLRCYGGNAEGAMRMGNKKAHVCGVCVYVSVCVCMCMQLWL